MDGDRLVWPRRVSVILAGVFALSIAHSVYRIPIQVSDSLEGILLARRAPSALRLLTETSRSSSSTLRPVRYLQARALTVIADVAHLSYHRVFRGAHALLAVLLVVLLTWVANPRTWTDVAAIGFALTVLTGLHTFDAMMREAFPVNHYAEVAAASLFVLGAALRPASRTRQILSVFFLAAGLLLIESSVLIWLVIISCAALRLPGMRPTTAVAATVVLAALLGLRLLLDVGSPGIGSHNTGWWSVVLSGDEAKARFAANPLPLYAYNVIGGALSLLASEPRFGVYQVLYARLTGAFSPVIFINIVSSLIVTSAIGWCCWRSLRSAFSTWTNEQKVLTVCVAVIAASAILCVTYIKDDIISTAGVFYAVMSFLAARAVITRFTALSSSAATVVAVLTVLFTSSLWAFRAAGTHYELARTAFTTRNDWALTSLRDLAGGDRASTSDLAVTQRIRTEALRQPVTSPSFLPEWGERFWIE